MRWEELWPRSHPPAPAGAKVGAWLVPPADPSPGARRQPPLCRDPLLSIPGLGDGEAASLRGGEAAERLPGVPDVLHRLVPAPSPSQPAGSPRRAAGPAPWPGYGSSFIHPELTLGLGRDLAPRLQGGSGEGKVPKTRGGDAASYCRRQPAVPGGGSVAWPHHPRKPCRGRSPVGWGGRAVIVQPADSFQHLVMCFDRGTEWDAGG